jgi:hypothetical protein
VKILVTLLLAFLVGCGSAPPRPNMMAMLDRIKAGTITVDEINQKYDDYYRAQAEYENSTGYKLGTGVLMLGLGAASLAAGSYSNCYYGRGYYGSCALPSKVTIGTTPTPGGSSLTTIKYYK